MFVRGNWGYRVWNLYETFDGISKSKIEVVKFFSARCFASISIFGFVESRIWYAIELRWIVKSYILVDILN